MQIVSAALGDCVNYRARRSPVFRCVVAGQYGKFLNTVHAEVQARRSARGAVRVVIDADAVYAVSILIGAMSAVAQLVAESAIPFIRAESGSHLVRDVIDTRLQGRQRCPIAAVQRQFEQRWSPRWN